MLIAVDTNVPLDLADGVEDVVDGLAVISERIKDVRLITPPTVNLELAYLSQFADEEEVRLTLQHDGGRGDRGAVEVRERGLADDAADDPGEIGGGEGLVEESRARV